VSAAPTAGDVRAPVLDIRGLRVEFPLEDGSTFVAVDGVDLSIGRGEIHALVGESGAGKTTVGNALMGLLERPGRIAAGEILFAGRRVDLASGDGGGFVQGKDIGSIFQDPMTSLNPLFTIASQLGETMRHHLDIGRAEARARALDLMNAVGMPEPERRLDCYPHQLSGGQRQRVVIAAALSCDPKLLVADEPTTALDVSVQAQILKLIRRLADERQLGVLLVTHNMGVVADVADRVTILQRGRVVESGPVADVLGRPQHPYAKILIGAVPRLDRRAERLPVLAEETPATAKARAAVRAKAVGDGQPDATKSASPGAAAVDPPGETLLDVQGLCVDYRSGGWLPGSRGGVFRAVDDVSFSVRSGEIVGLVGESGCGKSTVASVIAGLVAPTQGRVLFRGTEVSLRGHSSMRRAVQMIFQDPQSALNPRLRIGRALAEPILFYRLASGASEAAEDAAQLLEAVGLERTVASRFPHAFSGGQRQRVSIARALGARPTLLICDEPTSSLDVSVQAQILNLLKDLRDLTGLSMLFISHDLAVVRQMCDRVAVMKAGKIVESADAETLFAHPTHPYTRELLSLAPSLDKIDRPRALAPTEPGDA
jgi:peptide/nickel transport system ATP-binding protein